ncbi:MAG: trypsin-like peptidase domain-containing protein [Bacteroidales bacterium]|nr:trypsin-like peptidase domain-containing protein [Bacteroidales bacterium]
MMTYKQIWQLAKNSVCSLRFFNSSGIEMARYTGFKSGNFIFTSDHVNCINRVHSVEINFFETHSSQTEGAVKISAENFCNRIITIDDKDFTGFSLISTEDLRFEYIPSLNLARHKTYSVGQSLVVLGYQIDHTELTLKKAVLSCFTRYKDFTYIQFDGVIVSGNYGSPIFDTETGDVIGILNHSINRDNRAYENMNEIINSNIKLLTHALGKLNASDVDPIQVLIAGQHQIKRLSSEIYKQSTQGIGYALDVIDILQLLSSRGLEISNLSSSYIEV